ncbi:tetratricopeptide repeat protein [Pseudooceanicola sp. MF1-13]|uniref:tetratricopeptide repeat protein n=1 Tax=Pseudooceanicola sp. MF1-13 TaxID=3379095 RepID=UPI003892AE23
MSQSDSFIEEVTEEVRREKLYANMKKYGWIAILAVLLIVGGAAYFEYNRAQQTAQAEAYGDALLAALEQGDPAERATALESIDAATPEGRAVLAFLEAAELASADDVPAAVATLNTVAENQDTPPIYRALAQYRALALQGDTLSIEERRAGYEDLAGAGSPLRLLAEEQIAVTYIEDGNRDEALSRLNALLEEAGATPDLLRRVSQLIVALGATPGETEAAGD